MKFTIKIKNLIKVNVLALALSGMLSGCNYLDVVPDNVPTIDHAFANRNEAEKYLRTCYSYLPRANEGPNIMFFGADDMWTFYFDNYASQWPWRIARGEQNVASPYVNFWDGGYNGTAFFRAIRDCNILIEQLEKDQVILDLDPLMRKRWVAEAQFLKAYYHFYLLRMYGPIPITDVNLPISSTPEQVKVKRDPFDKVVTYISDLLDECAVTLPIKITNESTELGRVTRPAALMLKAKLLVTAASPLFNGNPNYANFVDKDGQHLFNGAYDQNKWQLAVDACDAAIKATEEAAIQLYTFSGEIASISDVTRTQMNIRGSVTAKWNKELIWGLTGSSNDVILQLFAMAKNLEPGNDKAYGGSYMAPTMRMAELFYTKNGVPINEDNSWDYQGRYNTKVAGDAEKYNIKKGYTTAKLHFDREPRFYASMAFDGAIWFMQNSPGGTDENAYHVQAKAGQPQAKTMDTYYSVTGYWPKKLVNWKYVQTPDGWFTTERYPWPEMRLGDLYLLYAEALNENGQGADALPWLDKIRSRAGLKGIQESWETYSTRKTKYKTKEGLREIIQQERNIEMAFEGERLWDIRRWLTAETLMNTAVIGWDIDQKTAAGYYRPKVVFTQNFVAPRDYLWPLMESNLLNNPNLVQNPGW